MNTEFKSDDQIPAHVKEHAVEGISFNHAGDIFKKAISEMASEVNRNACLIDFLKGSRSFHS